MIAYIVLILLFSLTILLYKNNKTKKCGDCTNCRGEK